MIATELARQASATILSNCVMAIWSEVVADLQASEPSLAGAYGAWCQKHPKEKKNRQLGSVREFVRKQPLEPCVSLAYFMCDDAPYDGTTTQRHVRLLQDMRNHVQHDRPEPYGPEYRPDRVEAVRNWYERLLPEIGHEALLWLPQVQRPPADRSYTIAPGLTQTGDAIIMKFMKYTVADRAIRATDAILREMNMNMSFNPAVRTFDRDSAPCNKFDGEDAELINRLWMGGE